MGIDHIKELVDFSRDNIRKDHPELLESGQVELVGKYELLLCRFVLCSLTRVL